MPAAADPAWADGASILPARSASQGAVFFDRDGCLNEDIGFLHEWAKFRWLSGAIEAVRLANQVGLKVFVVTNQSGIARGLYTGNDVNLIHTCMNRDLAWHGAWIDAFRFCPHHPQYGSKVSCPCRKPAPGMIKDLMHSWSISPEKAFLVGDRESDISAARIAGIAGYLVQPNYILTIVRREIMRLIY